VALVGAVEVLGGTAAIAVAVMRTVIRKMRTGVRILPDVASAGNGHVCFGHLANSGVRS
jgi:hypothetical protein